jgi:hypothetical protein
MYIVIFLLILGAIGYFGKYLYEIGGYPLVIAFVAFLLFLYIRSIRREKKKSFYVSAQGDDHNNGKSENRPFKTLDKAIRAIDESKRQKITIIGTLDKESENPHGWDSVEKKLLPWDKQAIFDIFYTKNRDLTITGKPGASDNEKAILSGIRGANSIVRIRGNASSKIIFENIEISNIAPIDEDSSCSCLFIVDTCVIIAKGTIIKNSGVADEDNHSNGIFISNGKLILDGGEVSGNSGSGIFLCENANLSMIDGKISGNKMSGITLPQHTKALMSGGSIEHNNVGVYVTNDGIFQLSDGKISENVLYGLWAMGNGKILMEGGIIEGNFTGIELGENGNLEISNGKISNNKTAGISINDNGSFTEKGGIITDNGENIKKNKNLS